MFEDRIKQAIQNSIQLKQNILENPELLSKISQVSQEIIHAFKNKIY